VTTEIKNCEVLKLRRREFNHAEFVTYSLKSQSSLSSPQRTASLGGCTNGTMSSSARSLHLPAEAIRGWIETSVF